MLGAQERQRPLNTGSSYVAGSFAFVVWCGTVPSARPGTSCSSKAYPWSVLAGPVVLAGGYLPWHGHCRSGASLDLGDDAGGHGGPDDVVAAVVLAGDAVQTLDVDGVGCADGRFQFGAAGNAAGPWFSPPGDWWLITGIVVKALPGTR